MKAALPHIILAGLLLLALSYSNLPLPAEGALSELAPLQSQELAENDGDQTSVLLNRQQVIVDDEARPPSPW